MYSCIKDGRRNISYLEIARHCKISRLTAIFSVLKLTEDGFIFCTMILEKYIVQMYYCIIDCILCLSPLLILCL